MKLAPRQILPDLWLFADTCNVFVVKRGEHAIAVDFGSGQWLDQLPQMGIQHLEHVFLTHHHADQCAGLQAQLGWPFVIHAPAGEDKFLDPVMLTRGTFQIQSKGCPDSYSVLKGGVPGMRYDLAGFTDFFWGEQRIRFLHTPGHGPNACSVILEHDSRQVVFCGDAAYSGARIWEPYQLEWDHWTGTGALAAWEGIVRLHGVGVDLLCPAHGPLIEDRPRAMLKALEDRLLTFYRAKGQISPGENDDYLTPVILGCGARQVLPHLYQYGTNGYVLRSTTGEGLVVDPWSEDMPALTALLDELAEVRPTAVTATHYHLDHCDAVPYVQQRYGTRVYLHPLVAEPLRDVTKMRVPWLPEQPIVADELWPDQGTWRWNEYEFQIAPWPGQTRWHCVFMTEIDGRRVALAGDSFQPSSRWNGTGGFCAYNGSRFDDGFIASAQLLLQWQPDIVACGHSTYYQFHTSKFRKIIQWATSAEKAVLALCPGQNLEQDYGQVSRVGTDGPAGFFWLNAQP